MNGLLRIRQRYQGLAQSDKKLADYLLLQPDTCLLYTSDAADEL